MTLVLMSLFVLCCIIAGKVSMETRSPRKRERAGSIPVTGSIHAIVAPM